MAVDHLDVARRQRAGAGSAGSTLGNVGNSGEPGESDDRQRAVGPFELRAVDVVEQVLLRVEARRRRAR